MTTNFTLRHVLQIARRRLWILVLCLVLAPAAAVAVSTLQEKRYTAKASLLFRDPQFDQKLFGSTFVQNSRDPSREAATNLELVTLETVAARTAQRFPRTTPAEVSGSVKAQNAGQADVLRLEASSTSARRAAALANVFAREYIRFRRGADRAKINAAQAPLRRQLRNLTKKQREGELGKSLAERLSQLKVLASLQTGNAELVQRAKLPTEPSSPKPVRNGIFGLLLGVLLGVGLVGLAEALDRRLRDPSEVEEVLRAPVLATLPESSSLAKAERSLSNVPEPEREAFRMLRANLRYFTLSRDIRSLLITSADAGDGKSTVAWGLAVASASAGSRTLLIEADLRRPSLAARFGLPAGQGLTSVLTGEVERQAAIDPVLLLPAHERGAERWLDVLVAGPLPPNPSDLVESEQMAQLIVEAERDYDLVVIDTPPISIVSDAIPLLKLVGGSILVSRLGNSSRAHVQRLRQQLDHLDVDILGMVINSAEGDEGYGLAYSYYRYGASPGEGPGRAAPDPGERAALNGHASGPPPVPAGPVRSDARRWGTDPPGPKRPG